MQTNTHLLELAYDAERNGFPLAAAAFRKLASAPSPITVERHWVDEDDSPDAPAENSEAWTDFKSGCVLFSVDDDGSALDLNIFGIEYSRLPVTLTTLAQIHTDLGRLLADPRVQAALPAGSPEETERPATTMVRVKDFTATCSFPMMLQIQVCIALDKPLKALGISERERGDLWIKMAQTIEELFDLQVGMGLLGAEESTKLVDAAYQQGANEVLHVLQGIVDKRPAKHAA